MIKTQNLSKQYGDLKAVDDVSFEIDSGEIVGLLGHNGAGKTTIMKMITGYLEPGRGEIHVDGMNLSTARTECQAKIGYLPENCPLYADMTVIDYLDYIAGLRGLDGEARSRAIREAIERLELRDRALQSINTLSRGYRQRVGVAQAILHSPEILILDEPTNGLDPSQIQHMRNIITELGKRSTVILSTHILQEVHAVCDRVLIIRNGRLALDCAIDELEKGQRLLLTVDRDLSTIKPVLMQQQAVRGVEFLYAENGRFFYALEVDAGDGAVDETTAPVARAVMDSGCTLYGLAPERRNLERIFSEINAASVDTEEELTDVA